MNKLRHIWIEITGTCNLKCIHCYAESSPSNKSSLEKEHVILALNEARELGAVSVQFTGGEPLIRYKDLEDFIAHSYQLGFHKIQIYSNLTFLPDDFLEFISSSNGMKSKIVFKTTFFSSNPYIHDFLARKKGAFEQLIQNVRKLLSRGIDVLAGVVLCELNSDRRQIKKLKNFLQELGIKNISFDFVRPQGRANLNFQFSENKICQIWKNCLSSGKICISYDGSIIPCIFFRDNILGVFPETKLAQAFEKLHILINYGEEIDGVVLPRKEKAKNGSISNLLSKENLKCGEFSFT